MFAAKSLPETERDVYNINWLNGTLALFDAAGNKFSVDANGDAEATTSPNPPPQPTPTLTFPAPTIQTLLTTSPTSPQLTNAPRLFIIKPDGSGVALWRDVDLKPYFSEQISREDVEISEEVIKQDDGLDKDDGVCVTIVGPPSKRIARLEEEVLVYRQLTRYPPLTPTRRTAVLEDMKRYKERVDSNDAVSAKYQPVGGDEILSSGGMVTGELEKGAFIFGMDRAATEEAIMRNFRLREERVRRREVDVREHETPQTPQTAPTLKRPKLLRHISTIPSAASQRTIDMNTRAVSPVARATHDIPKYFDSEEGKAFLKSLPKEKARRKEEAGGERKAEPEREEMEVTNSPDRKQVVVNERPVSSRSRSTGQREQATEPAQ
ncbi:hypothetical protein HK097_005933, partial [Rhizophlyctis rosea]